MASNPFDFGPYDRIFLDEVEITIEVDGKDKKAFVRKEGDQRPFIMNNDEIKAALDVDELVVERDYYDPRRKDLLASTSAYVRDLPEKKQGKVRRKLFWIMLLRQTREEMGGIPHDRRPTIMFGDPRPLHAELQGDEKTRGNRGRHQNPFQQTAGHRRAAAVRYGRQMVCEAGKGRKRRKSFD
ncbi:hypothetical protein ACOJBM_17155 [Rhizobium beringeri]